MLKKIVLSFILIVFIGCDENNPKEIDITVLSTSTEIRSDGPGTAEVTKFGIVNYTAKNNGTNKINGWKVYFNVHIDHGPQQLAHESIYYKLDPKEISEIRTVECIIPDYYEDAYKATLRHIDVW